MRKFGRAILIVYWLIVNVIVFGIGYFYISKDNQNQDVLVAQKVQVMQNTTSDFMAQQTTTNDSEVDGQAEDAANLDAQSEQEHKKDDEIQQSEKLEANPYEEPKKLTIMAVGDNLMHMPVVRSGLQADGSYNFDHLFQGIKKEIKKADLSIINQETILCDASLKYSGYPQFGTPYAVGKAIHDVGFDVVLQATNHTYDKGIAGMEDSLKFWKEYKDIQMIGINETDETKEHVAFYKENGITVAVLNYTYGLNGLKLPKGKEYMINQLSNRDQMKKDIAYAKENSDFVVVCPHWGDEYVYKPSQKQRELTEFFVEEGVDLVIGSHPHVLQPVEWVQSEDGTHRMLVYYSLGNFMSNQDAMAKILGGMAKVKIIKDKDGTRIDTAEIKPLVTHVYYDGKRRYVTYLLDQYSEKMASQHTMNQKRRNSVSLKKLKEFANSILGEWYAVAS